VIVDDVELRELVPKVLSVLVRRGADFATAEDAVQEALIRALSAWGDELPADPTGWLITVAWRAFLDMTRSEAARLIVELAPGDLSRVFFCSGGSEAVESAWKLAREYYLARGEKQIRGLVTPGARAGAQPPLGAGPPHAEPSAARTRRSCSTALSPE